MKPRPREKYGSLTIPSRSSVTMVTTPNPKKVDDRSCAQGHDKICSQTDGTHNINITSDCIRMTFIMSANIGESVIIGFFLTDTGWIMSKTFTSNKGLW